MSEDQIRVLYTRGGREFSRRAFSLGEIRQTTLGEAVRNEDLTVGMGNQFEIYVRPESGENEISAHQREGVSLEHVLRRASGGGEISGKTFVIDCTAEHKGALEMSYE
ncbi:MAG: hypothetical protein C4576_35395 [Desulfobacteraceae bacterium]|nr:MAG: hypothetical protein C4576_35395 [Desulfobacteraceae bacterium]